MASPRRLSRSGSNSDVALHEPKKLAVNYPTNMRYGRRQSMPATMLMKKSSLTMLTAPPSPAMLRQNL